ncbi:het domain protein [Colletotrichum musicola]|uniref:Het domain protein n=1 Tax=Colletotrichum musicola TaxID=2175873 RepID=A0A8H6ITE6_9PEZI|nr:het domain protein [Colletotrichum musicola]
MWLINTKSLELEEQPLLPNKYAILSHTWERTGEVTFRDMHDLSRAPEKAGFKKIQKTCEIARAAGLEWAWVDTCCIDKSSSAELTESINSMLEWYREARICYAYLSDLQPRERNPEATVEELKACRWFTRGWTLQELVASRSVNFFDQDWNARGMKDDLKTALHEITGIDMDVLDDPGALHRIPIARRMSWAARRSTTRVEDRAYSLFGIFDVNLPLIYGEGHKAFLRLQEAILQNSTDLSLFS